MVKLYSFPPSPPYKTHKITKIHTTTTLPGELQSYRIMLLAVCCCSPDDDCRRALQKYLWNEGTNVRTRLNKYLIDSILFHVVASSSFWIEKRTHPWCSLKKCQKPWYSWSKYKQCGIWSTGTLFLFALPYITLDFIQWRPCIKTLQPPLLFFSPLSK